MSNLQYIANRASTPARSSQPPPCQLPVTPAAPPPPESLAIDYPFVQRPVYSLNPIHLPLFLRSPRVVASACAAVAAAGGVATYLLTRRKPSAEELERERRDFLARSGRITDGAIMDTMVAQARTFDASLEETPATPNIIVYNYRIAGVTYECAQDVTALPDQVHDIRTDLPIQVRYAPHNPGNSIVVAESWSGLRLKSSNPHEPAHTQTP